MLQCAVHDNALQAGRFGELRIVVDLVKVAGTGSPLDKLLGGGVLHQLRNLLTFLDIFKVDLVCRRGRHDLVLPHTLRLLLVLVLYAGAAHDGHELAVLVGV